MKLVDDNGNVIVETLDQLRALVAEASRELIDAEKAAADLEEQARRAGVPPGWRR
jgi:F0F1-type ATP synthase membrane subunit b/b'